MPNICTNKLYLQTSDKRLRDTFMESIKQLFRCDTVLFDNGEIFNCEIEFDSRWTFPQKEMEKLTKDLPEDNDLYIRVLSYEFGCEYVGFNVYAGGGWHDKLADK